MVVKSIINIKNEFRTIEPIKAGTELKIHYDMDMEFAPEWYMVSGINYSVVKNNVVVTKEA